MRCKALQAGAVRSSAGRRATLCAEEAPKSNRTPPTVSSGRSVAGPRNISVVAKARAVASAMGVPCNAAKVHHANVVPWASHARRWARERQTMAGSGAKSTGAAKSFAPARYCPIMKIIWAAETRIEQSALIWPRMAERVETVVWMPTAVNPSRCASTKGWPMTQTKRTTARVSVAAWMLTSCSASGVNAGGGTPWRAGSSSPPCPEHPATANDPSALPTSSSETSASSSSEESSDGGSKDTMAPLGRTRTSPSDRETGRTLGT